MSNVLILTTDCNFRCRYCYQNTERQRLVAQKSLSPGLVTQFLETQSSTEPVVIFGGEPLLHPELVDLTVRKGYEINPKFAYSITTNGSLLLDDSVFSTFLGTFAFTKDRGISFKVEVSYDGTGHIYRVDKNGNQTKELVERSIDRLGGNGVPVTIRYTITKANYEHVVKDSIFILERFKNVRGIVFNLQQYALEKGVSHLKSRLLAVGQRYGVKMESYGTGLFSDKPSATATYVVPGQPENLKLDGVFDLFTRQS